MRNAALPTLHALANPSQIAPPYALTITNGTVLPTCEANWLVASIGAGNIVGGTTICGNHDAARVCRLCGDCPPRTAQQCCAGNRCTRAATVGGHRVGSASYERKRRSRWSSDCWRVDSRKLYSGKVRNWRIWHSVVRPNSRKADRSRDCPIYRAYGAGLKCRPCYRPSQWSATGHSSIA
jgi:hypothetical protein